MIHFVDLGAYTGDTLAIAMGLFPQCDVYHGFEPNPQTFAKLYATHGQNPKVRLYQFAVSACDDKEIELHPTVNGRDDGFSVCRKRGCRGEAFTVPSVRFSTWLRSDVFTDGDRVLLKVDIEGAEYAVFNDTDLDVPIMCRVSHLWVEWHYRRLLGDEKMWGYRHLETVRRLQRMGFGVTGKNRWDEFTRIAAR